MFLVDMFVHGVFAVFIICFIYEPIYKGLVAPPAYEVLATLAPALECIWLRFIHYTRPCMHAKNRKQVRCKKIFALAGRAKPPPGPGNKKTNNTKTKHMKQ